jgi:hypothetical protein
MSGITGEEPPPKSTDLEGWRRAVNNGSHTRFRLEEIVAAIQDLGPCTDKAVLNPLAKHLSDALMCILRERVSIHYPNRGDDIIERTHAQVIEAILTQTSADGKALRHAFVPRVSFRIKDALAAEARAARKPGEATKEDPGSNAACNADQTLSSELSGTASPDDPITAIDQSIDVENVLQKITNDQKRLAFRLYMDGIPFKSKKAHSIAVALDISERTAREWVKEVQAILSPMPEVQELLKSKTRGTP